MTDPSNYRPGDEDNPKSPYFFNNGVWNVVAEQLEEELGREPTDKEIRERMRDLADDYETQKAEYLSEQKDEFRDDDVVPH